jgi:hypothetical protein
VTGVCTWSVPVGANAACDPTTGIVKHCPDGLVCGPAGSADACVAPAELGDACIPGSCAAGLACTVFAGPAHCVDAIAPGGLCASMPDACGENHFCGFHDTCEPLPDPCADGCEPSLIFENICVG